MEFIPEWAPGVHPLIVHFPIAILFLAVAVDFGSLLLRRHTQVADWATSLYLVGALACLAAFLTGREAASGIVLTAAADPILSEHEMWAERVLWLYGILSLLRLAVRYSGWTQRLVVSVPLLLVGAAGLLSLWETGERGAQMVYQFGVGVRPVAQAAVLKNGEHHPEQSEHLSGTVDYPSGRHLRIAEDRSWVWKPGPGDEHLLTDSIRWFIGGPSDLEVSAIEDSTRGTVLSIESRGEPWMFVVRESFQDVQVGLRLNLAAFKGRVRIVHHVQDARRYDFTEVDGGRARLGRVDGDATTVFAEDKIEAPGWVTLRSVTWKNHFRAYADDLMVLHGHDKAPAAGPVGLMVEGTGVLYLSEFRAEPPDAPSRPTQSGHSH